MDKRGEQPADVVAIDGWWNAILAGGVDEPHPVHGDDLEVSIRRGVLHMAGTLPADEDRKELLAKARAFVGHGIDDVDARHLKVIKRKDKAGVLDQTLIAAFRNRDVAEIARSYLVNVRRLKAKQIEILDRAQEDKLRRLVPEGFIGDVQRAFKAGEAVLLLQVDEVDAFKVREMLAEDTRSRWTVAAPPAVAGNGRVDG
jgi:hypothetical protein